MRDREKPLFPGKHPLLCVAVAALAACASSGPTSSPPPPPSGPGPSFAISSPQDGATVSGPVYFAIQPRLASEVQSVAFTAGGAPLPVDAPGESAFEVFLVPRDFRDGPLVLRAVATGRDGSRSEQAITVHVVANPPSSATVGASGVTLGTTEASGARSTLTIPGGVAAGAQVTLAARTKDEVKAATGVDYDALGVTFLGAQEIASTQALSGPLGVASGGFGPMVQPGQVVVNYLILPDGDGDGVGELVAVNGAAVAPGGDVVSSPVGRVQLAPPATGSAGQRRGLAATGTLAGPPGRYLEIEASGFNPSSPFGNLARFRSEVNGVEIELPAVVVRHVGDPGARPALGLYLPPLVPGAATVTLRNVATGSTAGPLAVTIEAPPPLPRAPAVIIDEALAEAIAALSGDPALQEVAARLAALRTSFADLAISPSAADAPILEQLAVFLSNSNAGALLGPIASGPASASLLAFARAARASPPCSLVASLYFEALTAYGGFLGAAALGLFGLAAASAPISVPLGLALVALAATAGLTFGVGLTGLLACLAPLLEACPPPPSLEGLLQAPPMVPGTGAPLAAAAPPMPITGMGSVIPPGGKGCGCVVPGGAPAGVAAARSSLVGPPPAPTAATLLGDPGGRYVVKVFFASGQSVPFSGVSDSSGYFFIPAIPAGQPFQAIAYDTLTGETRQVNGVGPELETSTYLPFDFSVPGSSSARLLAYEANTPGTYGGTDVYLFQGTAGDVVNLAFHSELSPSDLRYQLADAAGFPIASAALGGGYFHELGPLTLAAGGLYTFTLDGTRVTGGYTLALSRVAAPAAIDFASPILGDLSVLGDRHLYSFTASAGDVLQLTLTTDGASLLDGHLLLRGPVGAGPFDQQPRILELATSATRRSVSGSRTLSVAGDYLLELRQNDLFGADLQRFLGTYRIDAAKTP